MNVAPDRLPALVALAAAGIACVAVVLATTPSLPRAVRATPSRALAGPDFTAAEIDRGRRYHRALLPASVLADVIGTAVIVALGFTGLGARLVGAVFDPVGGGWPVAATLGALAVVLGLRVVTLPLGLWSLRVRRRFGTATQSDAGWLADVLRATLITAVLAAAAATGLVGLARAVTSSWWWPAAMAGAALVLVASFLVPVLIEPIFNRFTPLEGGPVRDALLELAARAGVRVGDILVADASRRTTALNAYVSGLGRSRRVVVFDTLLRAGPDAGVDLVVAHELAHVRRHDVATGTLAGMFGAVAAACAAYLLLTWQPLLDAAAVAGAHDPRAVPCLAAVGSLLGRITAPAGAWTSRRIEARADADALDLTRAPAEFAAMQRGLAVANLADLRAHPLVRALRASHPATAQRIALARDWAHRHGVPPPDRLVPA